MKNSDKILLTILIIVSIGVIFVLVRPVPTYTGVTLEQLTDSLAIHDRLRKDAINDLQDRYIQDSMQIQSIKTQVNQLPTKLTNIKKAYDTKRNHIDTLPADEQLLLFSDALSKESNR